MNEKVPEKQAWGEKRSILCDMGVEAGSNHAELLLLNLKWDHQDIWAFSFSILLEY
jgi:hypothetical protein